MGISDKIGCSHCFYLLNLHELNGHLTSVTMVNKSYVAYLRQSTIKQQLSGLGIEAQREIIHNFIKDKTLIAEYVETESGKKSDRPQLM